MSLAKRESLLAVGMETAALYAGLRHQSGMVKRKKNAAAVAAAM